MELNQAFPKITVVTVVYNAVNDIKKTMESVLNQDYPNIEYIIIDGGSTDGTVDIITKHQHAIAYWVSEPDRGIYDAMNKGTENATGEWINFMNAGDTFGAEDALSCAVAQVQDSTEILYGASMIVDPLSGQKTYHPVRGLETFLLPEMPFIHQSVLVRLDVMKRYRYREDYRVASDFDFFFRAYRDGCRYQYIDQVIADFLGGGMHAYHMPQYMAEAINSLVQYSDDPRQLAQDRGVADACRWFYKEKKIEFSRSLGLLILQIEEIKSRYEKIVVYGYGSVGKIAAAALNPVALIDRTAGEGVKDGFRFIAPDAIGGEEYDALLITVLGRENEVMRDLTARGVPEAKIVRLEL